MNDTCLFCKIIKGEIPCFKIYEDEKVFSFLDINPINSGHVLVVPKKHCQNLLDASADDLSAIINVVPKIAKAVMSALDYPAFNLGVNNGSEAGQLVNHLHFHVMPRRTGDGHQLFKGHEMSKNELEQVVNKIKIKIANN